MRGLYGRTGAVSACAVPPDRNSTATHAALQPILQRPRQRAAYKPVSRPARSALARTIRDKSDISLSQKRKPRHDWHSTAGLRPLCTKGRTEEPPRQRAASARVPAVSALRSKRAWEEVAWAFPLPSLAAPGGGPFSWTSLPAPIPEKTARWDNRKQTRRCTDWRN
jgi:hypothetical protein